MSSSHRYVRDTPTGVGDREPTALAGGVRVFAGVLMTVSGVLQVLQGIALMSNDDFFTTKAYTYDGSATAWGWAHLIIGLILALVGIGVVMNSGLARAIGIAIVCVGALSNFLFLPTYPLWAIVLIAFNILCLWALVTAAEKW